MSRGCSCGRLKTGNHFPFSFFAASTLSSSLRGTLSLGLLAFLSYAEKLFLWSFMHNDEENERNIIFKRTLKFNSFIEKLAQGRLTHTLKSGNYR